MVIAPLFCIVPTKPVSTSLLKISPASTWAAIVFPSALALIKKESFAVLYQTVTAFPAVNVGELLVLGLYKFFPFIVVAVPLLL
jgi:hypothetical protein